MQTFLQMLGLPYMPPVQLAVFLALVAVAMLLLGWVADMALGEAGYGVILNGMVMLAGAIGGVLLWRKLGYQLPFDRRVASLLVATASGTVLLLVGAISRRWL